MRKLIDWFKTHVLQIAVGFLLFFIPLWPKVPLLDVSHTWVYIRVEDFVVLAVDLLWLVLMLFKRVSLKTPLTLPIFLFWIIGAISTIHSVLLILPGLAGVFPNVALLSYLRRIEYMSLFFIAYSAVKDKQIVPYVIGVLTITLLFVFAYGVGQKFLGFPAFLTMNEEFAKGIPIRLSQLSRISSTFGGHYDLAAYLVLIIPILVSVAIGLKNWLIKLFLLATVSLGFVLLFMTVSRISFFVLLLSLGIILLLQKKKTILFLFVPAIVIMVLFLLIFSPSLLQRFGNTVKEVDVLINSKTGEEIGHVKDFQTKQLSKQIVKFKFYPNKDAISLALQEDRENVKIATTAGIISSSVLPPTLPLLTEPNAPTGENLPQGTNYINLSLSPIIEKPGAFLYRNPQLSKASEATTAADFFAFQGDFLIKRARAYDLSFTTRFQGEWPNAIAAFKRNIILGSGYSSVGLAVDNNYLRILAETGFLGFFSFLGIFFLLAVYIKNVLPQIDSSLEKNFVIGLTASLFGLALNAVFIDVFEASKVAYLLWLLVGITFGILSFHNKNNLQPFKETKKLLTSSPAIICYLFFIMVMLFSSLLNNYFIGDDFTWLRWAADRKYQSIISTVFSYFTNANGFFYRPGTKIYFLLMYSGFWLNQTIYYMVSLFLHFVVTVLVFLLSKKVLKNLSLSVLAAFCFLVLSGSLEAVFWISSTGFLFNAVFILSGLLFFILWEEEKKTIYFVLSYLSIIFGLLFHELGVVGPFIILLYRFSFKERFSLEKLLKDSYSFLLLFPLLPYLGLRLLANSHWLSGDYSYNLLKLPLNVIGNLVGYLSLTFFGPSSLPFYQLLRNFAKGQPFLGFIVSIVVIYALIKSYRIMIKKITEEEQKIIVFCFLFFIIALLPFLGLGNIASRYSYLSSVGLVMLFVSMMKKLYGYLSEINGQSNSAAVVTALVCIFFLIHLIQLQKVQGDWHNAGSKTKRFLTSVDSVYSGNWTKESMQLYFVDVPIRQGDAWVFPTGLNEALWFVFRNPNLHVYQSPSVEQAISMIGGLPTEKVFQFDDSGGLVERHKCKDKPCSLTR